MNCNCGKSCCQSRGPLTAVAGLGFLYSGGGDDGGGNWWDSFYAGGGGDFWGFDDPFWSYNPNDTVYWDTTTDRFLPAGAGNRPLANSPVNWWEYFLPNFGGGSGGGNAPAPALPGYCPGGYYHPLDDPFACVPFPIDPATGPQQTPRSRPATTQPRRATPKVSPQTPQQCPAPGRVNPQTGRCECPQGLVYNAAQRRCVQATLANRLASEGPGGLPWWLILLGGAVVLKVATGGRR